MNSTENNETRKAWLKTLTVGDLRNAYWLEDSFGSIRHTYTRSGDDIFLGTAKATIKGRELKIELAYHDNDSKIYLDGVMVDCNAGSVAEIVKLELAYQTLTV